MKHLSLVALLLFPLDLWAETALNPYKARYSTKAMGLTMNLSRSLSEEGGRYTLRNKGKVMVASLEEVATFTLDNGQIRGDNFRYKLGGIVNRKREVQFDPDKGVIRSLKKDEWSEHPWSPEILDRLSQQEQLRLALMNAEEPPATLTFTVIDGPRVKEKAVSYVGEEVLSTEAGKLNTLHYRMGSQEDKRYSDVWLAVDYDFLMVMTRHFERGEATEVRLVNAEINGALIDPEGPAL